MAQYFQTTNTQSEDSVALLYWKMVISPLSKASEIRVLNFVGPI